MTHTYASVAEFADYLRDNGSSDLGETLHPEWLVHLEGASRRIDAYCGRSRFGSGFGPRVGTNRYDYPGWTLNLGDDLLSLGTVTTYESVGGSGTTLTDETDFLKEPYEPAPYRALRIHGDSSATWGGGDRGNEVFGTWGYSNETLSAGTVALASSTATAGTMTAGSASPGQTLLVGSEQVYVTASAGGTALTVVRGVNGTTAAAGTAAASVYRYPREVTQACLQIALRRWKSRDAGVTGDYNGGLIPTQTPRDTERSILNATVHHLRIYSA